MLLLNRWAAQATTRSGIVLNIRSASPADRDDLAEFLNVVSPTDLRFRFLSAVKPSASLARILSDVDHQSTESLVAFDARSGSIVATAMIACGAEAGTAEIAVLVRSDLAGHGVGWKMLEEACAYARARGYQTAQCVESSANARGIALEREQGFSAHSDPESGVTVLTKDLS